MTVWFSSFISLVELIVKTALPSWVKAYLANVYYRFCVLLDLIF